MGFDNAMWQLDQGVTGLFAQWNAYTTALVTLLVGIVTVHVATRRDPDTHPLLLARQGQAAPVRNEGESPAYRSRSTPHGMTLNAGLDVRDPGTARWAKGRDGDLRDIWRRAAAGVPVPETATGGRVAGSSSVASSTHAPGTRGRLLTAYGSTAVVETPIDTVTRQINLVGQHLQRHGGTRVAIYLPNSVELLASLFACAFYHMTPILLPFGALDDTALVTLLRRSKADTIVTAPGVFPLDAVATQYPALRQIVWVVADGNAHLEWNEVPEGTGGRVHVATWHDILDVPDGPDGLDAPDAGLDLPPVQDQGPPCDLVVFWEPYLDVTKSTQADKSDQTDPPMIHFTSANIVAAVSAQIVGVPASQRLGPSDLFLPADSLTHTHTLVLLLAALYANASVVLNSAAAHAPSLAIATRGVAPTVVVANPGTVLATHRDAMARFGDGVIARLLLRWQTSLLHDGGVMPVASSLVSRLFDTARPALGATPGKLRLLYIAERAGAGTPPVASSVLAHLRILTGARVVYALAAAHVAGAAAQTNFYDYRILPGTWAPFGPPLTSTEIVLRDTPDVQSSDDTFQGEIVVRGTSVAGTETALGVNGRILDDNTLAYL